jgi:hypothetical protein
MTHERLYAASERPLPFRKPQQCKGRRHNETAELDGRVPALLHGREWSFVDADEEEKINVTNHHDGVTAGRARMRRLRRDNERSWTDHGAELAAQHVRGKPDGTDDADDGQ